MHDRKHSPAADRNRQPILDVLLQLLPACGAALEIASGTGQHAAWFAAGLPGWTWQPSDAQADDFSSIAHWCSDANVANVSRSLLLDVLAAQWPSDGEEFTQNFDAIFCANMLHIAPWQTCAGLMQGAARYLSAPGMLITYGPYLERDVPTASGNVNFDHSLRQRNAAWGIRALEDVVHQATLAGLRFSQKFQMPANNLLLVFKRQFATTAA